MVGLQLGIGLGWMRGVGLHADTTAHSSSYLCRHCRHI